MSSSARPTGVRFDADSMWVDLSDGRIVGVPLAWFPRLLHAAAEQREQVRLSIRGLHWEASDEDISLAGLLAGLGDQTNADTTGTFPMGARVTGSLYNSGHGDRG